MSTESDLNVKIRAEFINSGYDVRYLFQAYTFVLQGLEFFLAKTGEKKHVSGDKLAYGLAEFAYRQFGPLAIKVLASWGIHETDDFGFIVFNLIKIGAMSKQESDKVEDFFNVFSLKEYFENIDYYIIDKNLVRNIQGA
jgi:uncharacterized repeat protein (TIGR04138 family)